MSNYRGPLILLGVMGVLVALLAVAVPVEPAAGTVEVVVTSPEGHVVRRVYAAGKWHYFVESPK